MSGLFRWLDLHYYLVYLQCLFTRYGFFPISQQSPSCLKEKQISPADNQSLGIQYWNGQCALSWTKPVPWCTRLKKNSSRINTPLVKKVQFEPFYVSVSVVEDRVVPTQSIEILALMGANRRLSRRGAKLEMFRNLRA